MHARDRDAVLQPHELGQHLGPLDDRDLARPRLDDFRILLVDGGAGDHHSRSHHVGGGVALKNRRAQRGQPVGNRRAAQVGAGDGIAEGQQDLGDAAHADAANPNEMNALCFGKHRCPVEIRSLL